MMRTALIGGLAAAAFLAPAAAAAFPTTLCIRNLTPAPVTTRISEIDNYDWDDDVRPDHNFDRVEIAPDTTFCAPEHTNGFARPSFSLQLLPDPTLYRIVAGSSLDGANRPFGWALHRGHGGALHGDPSVRTSDPRLEIGYRCDAGSQCWLFALGIARRPVAKPR